MVSSSVSGQTSSVNRSLTPDQSLPSPMQSKSVAVPLNLSIASVNTSVTPTPHWSVLQSELQSTRTAAQMTVSRERVKVTPSPHQRSLSVTTSVSSGAPLSSCQTISVVASAYPFTSWLPSVSCWSVSLAKSTTSSASLELKTTSKS